MVKKQNEQSVEIRENVCGGSGKAQVRQIFTEDEMTDARMFSHITIEPGTTFGKHTHHEEAEIYYVLKGELVTGEESGEYVLHSGDAAYTGDNEYHYLKNVSSEPAELMAVIVGKGSVTLNEDS